jgi:hypothetical protein
MPDERRPASKGDKIPATRARQAVVGHHAIVVLAVSLTLALIAGAVLLGWFWMTSPGLGT